MLAEAWSARRDGGHRGRARGVQVPLRAGGRQLPSKGILPARSWPGLASSRAAPVARPSAPQAASSEVPLLGSAPCCPRGGPHPAAGFASGMCRARAGVDFLKGSPSRMRERLGAWHHVHILPQLEGETRGAQVLDPVEVAQGFSMSPVNTSFTESKLVGAVDAAILVYSALSFYHVTPFSFINSCGTLGASMP